MVLREHGRQERLRDISSSTFFGKTAALVGFPVLSDFAAATGLHLYKDVLPATEATRANTRVDDDPAWLVLAALVNDRLAKLLAAKEEIERKLRVDGRKRAEQRRKVEER